MFKIKPYDPFNVRIKPLHSNPFSDSGLNHYAQTLFGLKNIKVGFTKGDWMDLKE